MSGWQLTLRQAPALRVDARALSPAAFAGLAPAQIERVTLTHGTQVLPLAEFFRVEEQAEDGLSIDGDLSRFDRIGWQLAGSRIEVRGAVGAYAGACMNAGELVVHGDAGLLAGCEMAGGTLTVDGNVGDHAAGNQPGSMDGMRGGTFVVRGNAGARCGDRMRRGTLVVHGDAGDFLASRMVAGTIALGGTAGAHVGYGMRRGSVVFAGAVPAMPATFVPAGAEAAVFWQLLARDLARHGGPFAGLPARGIERHLGDLSAAGKGELIAVR
ncbi:MAG: formylmethanofuran dehydrogenase subunit C [Proteobacteria bacterium]|nr:formylmethanofuran dehydrogenase subunit C [Pseudomonadota bacterium]